MLKLPKDSDNIFKKSGFRTIIVIERRRSRKESTDRRVSTDFGEGFGTKCQVERRTRDKQGSTEMHLTYA